MSTPFVHMLPIVRTRPSLLRRCLGVSHSTSVRLLVGVRMAWIAASTIWKH